MRTLRALRTMHAWAAVVSLGAAATTLGACAAVLGLPDPALDDTIVPGDDGATRGPDGTANEDGAVTDDSGGRLDAGTDALGEGGNGCDLTKPFGPASAIVVTQSGLDDWQPALTADELTLLFVRHDTEAPLHISQTFITRRASIGAPWDGPVALQVAIGSAPAAAPCLTGDGKRIYYSGLYNGSPGYIRTVSFTNGAVDSAKDVEEKTVNNLDPSNYCGSLLPNGTMYFHHEEVTQLRGGFLLRAARNTTTNSFDAPVALSTFTPTDIRSFPVVSADDQTLFYAQTSGAAPRQIWMAQRPTPTSEFMADKPVDAFTSTGDDLPGWLSPDGCRMYFSSDRKPTAGGHDLYVASRPK